MNKEGAVFSGLSWTVLPVAGILTKEPVLALGSAYHPNQRNTMPYHYQM